MKGANVAMGALGLAALAGCSLVADLSQFDQATNASAVADSGDPPGDEATLPADDTSDATTVIDVDGGSDSAATDAVSPDDAADASAIEGGAADGAADATETGGLTWCQTIETASTVFCKDFDDGRPAVSAWTSSYFSNPADAVLPPDASPDPSVATAGCLTPPGCALMVAPTITASDQAYQQLTQSILYKNAAQVHFSILIPDLDHNVTDLSLVRIAYSSSAWSISHDVGGGGAFLNESLVQADGGITQDQQPTGVPDFTQWTDVDVSVDFKANTMTIAYNGMPAAGSPFTIKSPQIDSQPFTVTLGINYLQGPSQAMHVYLDDIDIEAQ